MTATNTFSEEMCHGWGKVTSIMGRVVAPPDLSALKDCLQACRAKGLSVTLRAGGNSYGDLITNTDGVILDLRAFDRIVDVDFGIGTIVVQPGVPLGAIADHCLTHGWAPSAVPGTPFVTVGGAISNNVHGKDCFAKGNFGDSVLSMQVLLAAGTIVTASRNENCNIFDAVVGGLGLCGIVTEATLKLERVESGFLDVELVRFDSPEALLALFTDAANGWHMLVAWIDAFDDDGRGILEKGRWARAPENLREAHFTAMSNSKAGTRTRRIIGTLMRPFIGRWLMRTMNTVFYITFPLLKKTRIRHFSQFNFIVTQSIPEPPDLYPGGMIEVQILIPMTDAAMSIRRIIKLCKQHKQESWWCGVKMHRGERTPISFTGNGISLSVNLPGRRMREPDFDIFLDAIIEIVAGIGGRIYIGKDLVLRGDHIARLFPDAADFIAAKRQLDPDCVFENDLARRLFLK